MRDFGKKLPRLRTALVGAAVASIAGVGAWVASRGPSATFSDHPRAQRLALAQRDGDVLIMYHRCGDDLIPYVDASEVIGDEKREWEVAADVWFPSQASWIARRHPTGEAEPAPEEFEGPIPPPSEVRLDVHVYSASIESRWHVRINELPVRDLPETSIPIREVVSGDGEAMSYDAWSDRAGEAC